jgi:hypothetical protein
LVEFNAESPSFLAALDTHLQTLVGETAYEWYKDDIETIKTFVEQWMRELLDNCRGIPFRPPNNGQDNTSVPYQGQTEEVNDTANTQGHSLDPTNISTENMQTLLTDQDTTTMPENSDFLDLDWAVIDSSNFDLGRTTPLFQHDNPPDGDVPPQPAEVHHTWRDDFNLHLQSHHRSTPLAPYVPISKAQPAQNFAFPPTPAPSQPSASTPAPSLKTDSTPARMFNAKEPGYTISKSFARLNTLMSRQAFQLSVGPEMARELHMGQLPFDVAFRKLQKQVSVTTPKNSFPQHGTTSLGGATQGPSRVNEGSERENRNG